jgi:hypothetical protein
LDNQSWAQQEFANAELGDKRRTQRLARLAEQRCSHPQASFSQACGNNAETKAAYRFYENDSISPSAILSSHQQATQTRMSQESIILAIQDTTELDYTHHPDTKGLGVMHDKEHHGLMMHTTIAVTPQRVPLGVIHQQVWSRPEEDFGKKHKRKQRPISEKESQRWLTSLEVTSNLSKQITQTTQETTVVNIGDREADIYDLFMLSETLSQHLLIRACWNRLVAHPEHYLWTYMESQPDTGRLTITVPRKDNQPSRQAELIVRYAQVTLNPPRRSTKSSSPEVLAPITLWSVFVCEEQPPQGVEPISWLLLSSLPVNSFEEACERVSWYTCRWVIEIYHKVLKSGCRVEERQFEDSDTIKRYLSIDCIVSWRILYLTMLGRDKPELPCTAILEAYEWQSLYCFIHKTNIPPEGPPTLKQVTRWIAQLGGFMGRKGDGEPGVTVLWLGFQRLYDIANSWLIFHLPSSEPRNVGKD